MYTVEDCLSIPYHSFLWIMKKNTEKSFSRRYLMVKEILNTVSLKIYVENYICSHVMLIKLFKNMSYAGIVWKNKYCYYLNSYNPVPN